MHRHLLSIVILLSISSFCFAQKLPIRKIQKKSAIHFVLDSDSSTSWIDSLSMDELNATNQWKRSALTYAIFYNDTLLVRKLVEKSVDYTAKDKWGFSPLEYSLAVNKLLADNFPDSLVTQVDTTRVVTARKEEQERIDSLYRAYRYGRDTTGIAKELLEIVDPNTPYESKGYNTNYIYSIIPKLIYFRNDTAVSQLVAAGGFIGSRNSDGEAGFQVMELSDTTMVKLLLQLGADVNSRTTRGVPLSAKVAEECDMAMVKLFVSLGMEITPEALAVALDKNKRDMALWFADKTTLPYEYDAAVDVARTDDSLLIWKLFTPEHMNKESVGVEFIRRACEAQWPQTHLWILKNNIPLNDVCKRGLVNADLPLDTIQRLLSSFEDSASLGAALYNATGKQNHQVMKLILEKMKSLPDSLLTLPSMAAWNQDTTAISLLLKYGARLDTFPSSGNLPLSTSINYRDKSSIAKWLLEKGAPVNGQNRWGNTALHQAISHKEYAVAEMLLEHGADPMIKNKEGRTVHFELVHGDDTLYKSFVDKFAKRDSTKSKFELSGLNLIDTSGVSLFDEMCMYGDTNMIAYALELGKKHKFPNKKELGKGLMWALDFGYSWNMVRYLYALNPSLAEVDTAGNTALHYFTRSGHTDLMEEALKKGAKIEAKNNAGFTPLLLACQKFYVPSNFQRITKVLFDAGASVKVTDTAGRGPLSFVGDTTIFKALLAKGASVNVKGYHSPSLLLDAIDYKESDIALVVIKRVKNPNYPEKYDGPPLTQAVEKGSPELVKALIKRGANKNHPTILPKAIYNDDTTIVKLLFKLGAKVPDQRKYGALMLKDVKSEEMFDLLLLKANSNAKDSRGRTPLFFCKRDTVQAAKLLAKGARLNVKDTSGENLLSYAASRGDSTLFNWFQSKGVKPIPESDIFFLAIEKGNKNIVEKLLEAGLSVDTKKGGYTPLHFAALKDFSGDILSLILAKTSDIELRCDGITPLMAAAMAQNSAAVKVLLRAGADVNAVSLTEKRTALHYGAIIYTRNWRSSEHLSTLKALLNGGADFSAKDRLGRTPLDWAIEKNCKEIASFFTMHTKENSDE